MMQIRILFLGASRFVGLMERFKSAAEEEGIEVDLGTVEDDSPWHVVAAAGVARAIPGPRFLEPAFGPFLLDLVKRGGINVVIPHIDPATIALARLKPELKRAGVNVIVSEESLCTTMYDKRKADAFFRAQGIPVPEGENWPKVAKPRLGSSSRGHVTFRDREELQFWSGRNRIEDYLVQPFVSGTEYSVDAFVGPNGKPLGAVARIRIVVSGGEVMVAKTDRNQMVLDVAEKVLAVPGWYGPMNIQVMHTGAEALLLEVNPRFGSGATLAIEAGLDSPRWIIREFLGRPLPEKPIVWRPGLFLTRCRKDYFLWS